MSKTVYGKNHIKIWSKKFSQSHYPYWFFSFYLFVGWALQQTIWRGQKAFAHCTHLFCETNSWVKLLTNQFVGFLSLVFHKAKKSQFRLFIKWKEQLRNNLWKTLEISWKTLEISWKTLEIFWIISDVFFVFWEKISCLMGEPFCSIGTKFLVDDNELLVLSNNIEELFGEFWGANCDFLLSNGRESGEGIEERNSQQNEG